MHGEVPRRTDIKGNINGICYEWWTHRSRDTSRSSSLRLTCILFAFDLAGGSFIHLETNGRRIRIYASLFGSTFAMQSNWIGSNYTTKPQSRHCKMQRKAHKVTFQPIHQLVKSFEITNVFGIVGSGECEHEHCIINISKQRAPSCHRWMKFAMEDLVWGPGPIWIYKGLIAEDWTLVKGCEIYNGGIKELTGSQRRIQRIKGRNIKGDEKKCGG